MTTQTQNPQIREEIRRLEDEFYTENKDLIAQWGNERYEAKREKYVLAHMPSLNSLVGRSTSS